MKGITVALIWAFVILIILSLTYPIWSFAIGEIVTHAGGDQFTILLTQSVFVVLSIAVVSALAIYRQRPEIDYQW